MLYGMKYKFKISGMSKKIDKNDTDPLVLTVVMYLW
jgi:hypothetical protein